MTKREKVLAKIVLCTVPLALLFVGFFVYLGKKEANEAKLVSLNRQIDTIKVMEKKAQVAGKHSNYYKSISLPAEFDEGVAQYKKWLIQTLNKNLAENLKANEARPTVVRFSDPDSDGFHEETLAREQGFQVSFDGTILHLTRFLHDFYSLEMLHRISTIKITTRDTVDDRTRKKTRSDKLTVSMTIQVLSLVDAEADRRFEDDYRELAKSLDDYEESIVYRNIFGVANTAPDVQVTKTSSGYAYRKDVKIKLTAKDVDKQDQHTFKLLDSEIEGAKLINENPKSGTAQLFIPGSEGGRYKFEVECTDTGFPAKTKKKSFEIVWKDKVIPKGDTDSPRPKPIKLIGVTYIGSRLMNLEGQEIVWIKTRTTNKKYELKVGDSFKLDDDEWTVKSLVGNEIVLQSSKKVCTYRPGDRMDKPSGGSEEL